MLNSGVSFGLLPNVSNWVIGLVLVALIFYAGKMRELWGRVGIWLMIIGGAGNLYSRVIYGGVSDNLDFFGLVYNNVADYLIFIGLVVYGYTSYFRR